jgi:nucleoside-diphosphate-sugar epimerase
MKKVLLLGGTRFIGYAVLVKLVSQYQLFCFHRGLHNVPYHVEVEDILGDRMCVDDVRHAFKEDYDIVVDISGEKQNAVLCSAYYAKDHADKYIYLSSSSVYSNESPYIYKEESNLNTSSTDAYIKNKIAGEIHVQDYFKNYVILRTSKVYGPWNYITREKYYYDYLCMNMPIVLARNPILHFTYVEDVAAAVLSACSNVQPGIYNVAGAEPAHLSEFIHVMAAIIGCPYRIDYDLHSEAPFSHLLDCVLDCSKANMNLNWRANFDLNDGLFETLKYFRGDNEFAK